MKVITRFFKLFIPACVGLGMIVTSCRHDDNYFAVGDFLVSFGTIEKKSSATNDYVIHLDNGNQVIPLSTSAPWFQVNDNQRVLVDFNPLVDQRLTDSTVAYRAVIRSLRDILFKGIKKYTEVADDSMGHDPIIVRDSWISKTGGILTMKLDYLTQGSTHYINLIDNGEGNGIVQPFILELRHNARGDLKKYPATAYVSFKLDYLKLTGKNETKFYVRYTDYEGRRIDLPYTFRY
ncbi:MAG: NigD-like C-terminal domain-containing protein [Mariniphaga sp.]